MKKLQILVSCILLTSLTPMLAQKSGNIVEYFGKERVEQVDEGIVFHSFREGFTLPSTAPTGYLFTSVDALAWEIATNKFTSPSADNLNATNYGLTRQAIHWTPIEADSVGKFKGQQLRRSYLYTNYEAEKSEIVLLEASGNTRTFVNGFPREGDHYDFAYTLLPLRLKKGSNDFIFTHGRFGRVEAKLIKPSKPVMFTKRDMTLPDIINGENDEKWGAIRIVNALEKGVGQLTIKCTLASGESVSYKTDELMALTVRKVKFKIPASSVAKTGEVKATLTLMQGGKEIDTAEIVLQQKDVSVIHERTFVSNIDNSVQYYSVTPSSTKGDGQALFLSVHGASVEARNQARAYAPKDWGHVVAATNRRPFGFNWEEWGRIDALEVLAEGKKVFKTAPEKTYLTGHSMGGHGSWYLGATYPDHFASVAPCAGYPDIAGYRNEDADAMHANAKHFDAVKRAANGGRVLELKRNYLQSGIYVLHGDADNVVPVEQARKMREELGKFHPDFCYYEYPGGSHWYSNESVDWKPIFDFFKWHTIPANEEMKHLEFHTASPAISAKNHWATIEQQDVAYDFSSIVFDVEEKEIKGTTKNVAAITLDLPSLKLPADFKLQIDGSELSINTKSSLTLAKVDGKWSAVSGVKANEKNPARYGGFKQAINNNVVFVYATGGNSVENEWYQNKARFDAETFLYRGNGSIEVIADRDFVPTKYADRNVMIYGNASNNKAWAKLLKNSPIQVLKGEIKFGKESLKGESLGTYFIYPRPDSSTASVGVVAGTGMEGMKATYPNDYISGITGFPDVLIFDVDMLRDGIRGVQISGFLGNDWSIEKGSFVKE